MHFLSNTPGTPLYWPNRSHVEGLNRKPRDEINKVAASLLEAATDDPELRVILEQLQREAEGHDPDDFHQVPAWVSLNLAKRLKVDDDSGEFVKGEDGEYEFFITDRQLTHAMLKVYFLQIDAAMQRVNAWAEQLKIADALPPDFRPFSPNEWNFRREAEWASAVNALRKRVAQSSELTARMKALVEQDSVVDVTDESAGSDAAAKTTA